MPAARPRLPRPIVGGLLVLATLGLLGACSSEPDVSRATFQSDLAERTNQSDALVACLTERIWDQFDQGERNQIYRAASEQELSDVQRAKLKAIDQACLAENPLAPAQPPSEGG